MTLKDPSFYCDPDQDTQWEKPLKETVERVILVLLQLMLTETPCKEDLLRSLRYLCAGLAPKSIGMGEAQEALHAA